MKFLLPIIVGVALLAGCGSDNNDKVVMPPVQPPVDPPVEPPVEPPTMMPSFAAFTRTVFADDANAMPREVNNMQFNQDAADDDFADLLQ